ncbi:conserved hypothetical protein [Ricinus communis]|uniref:Uncharacterized protein n=1 Tax=Ricinus communis TaxID=3988 RepID=B9TPX5_RICCO|nr:conserved hypothetical protein [Ricinus communis]
MPATGCRRLVPSGLSADRLFVQIPVGRFPGVVGGLENGDGSTGNRLADGGDRHAFPLRHGHHQKLLPSDRYRDRDFVFHVAGGLVCARPLPVFYCGSALDRHVYGRLAGVS